MNTNTLLKTTICIALLSAAHAATAAVVDSDNDGLIEINSLDDLNEIRNSLNGTSLRGSSSGCPNTGCFGYELTRDLDFDTNGNGVIDSDDWNGGQPWKPIGYNETNAFLTFSAVFNGNFHTIRHLNITHLDHDYGYYALFGVAMDADIRNVGLLDAVVNVIHADRADVATLVGATYATTISGAYAERSTVTTDSALRAAGLVGIALERSIIKNSYYSGNVTGNFYAGGLVGWMGGSIIQSSFAKGSVNAQEAAGLVADIFAGEILDSYSNVQVSGRWVGGLVETVGQGPSSIRNCYALGSINAEIEGGGLVRWLIHQANLTITNSYTKNVIQLGSNQYANLVASIQPSATYSIGIESSFAIKDPQGVELPANSGIVGADGDGKLLADMQCASNPVNNTCAHPSLFQEWDTSVWDFGTTSQLPSLKFKSNFPWMSTDTPGGDGDFESIARVKDRKPEYACDSPSDFYAKEKNRGYVFNARTPEKFKSFNAKDGFVCLNADQSDAQCNNYEVSYLCDLQAAHPPIWTSWQSSDTPNGQGDYENNPSSCAIGIRARVVGDDNSRYGAPQKLATFSLAKGMACKNADNADGCKDYEVRMTCEVLGDR
jgi:hypothetical protein